jgi:predicted helicase
MSIQSIQVYRTKVEKIIQYGGSHNESALRKPFQELLDVYAQAKGLLLVPEVEFITPSGKKVYPDGTLKDALRQDWGYWESKDEKDDLEAEIITKFNKGYPSFNILFEDTHTAILYQSGVRVQTASFTDAPALDALLASFAGYEPPEVREFHKAIELFSAEVGGLAAALRDIIDEQIAANEAFKTALDEFLELARKAINPKIEMADMREMIIQHLLTEDIFMRVFDEAEFHRDNIIARKLQEVAGTFYKGAVKHNIHTRIAPYYETINAKASQISDHHEKQKFLKALYEKFYQAYNPKAADRLGIVYTPDEIVRFMIESADYLTFQHFGKTLGDKGVEILDPATGTGTFITELIEYLPKAQLPYKYKNEIHCNEVAILPYYIANLNIEYTYKQKMGEYQEFENICFVDTLDNLGFQKAHTHQLGFLGLVDGNAIRISRQNERKISVVIGNPPYNANQMNENENNKNREYPEIDKRIKETYIKHSTAQKTKVYDMYARFIRWASDRLDKNGVIAFITNSSFLDSRTFDGFRKVVVDEFSDIYIVDLGGNIRKNPKLSGPKHNVFAIQTGVCISFLIKSEKKGKAPAHIHYARRPEMEEASDKLEFVGTTKFSDIKFEFIHPDKSHNWLNLEENDWSGFLPLASKEAKAEKGVKEPKTVFRLYSLGVITNRDEWVYDDNEQVLHEKICFLIDSYNSEVDRLFGKYENNQVADKVNYIIKWTRAVKRDLYKGIRYKFNESQIVDTVYRPFVKRKLYFDRNLNEMQYQMPSIFPNGKPVNIAIAINTSIKVFNILVSDHLIDMHFNGDSQCFPLFRYTQDGARIDNITDWVLNQFQKHYKDKKISKESIFHYVYAVLHHPAYRTKYEINLKREFPRIPFYADFWQWAGWGQRLMDLHLNYETVEPFPLEIKTLKVSETFRVTPRLIARKEQGVIEVDTVTTLHGVPSEAWQYRLGTYTALEWILERYKEKTPKDPTIREKFNTYRFADYKEQVIDLLGRVCRVSVETMRVVGEMPESSG